MQITVEERRGERKREDSRMSGKTDCQEPMCGVDLLLERPEAVDRVLRVCKPSPREAGSSSNEVDAEPHAEWKKNLAHALESLMQRKDGDEPPARRAAQELPKPLPDFPAHAVQEVPGILITVQASRTCVACLEFRILQSTCVACLEFRILQGQGSNPSVLGLLLQSSGFRVLDLFSQRQLNCCIICMAKRAAREGDRERERERERERDRDRER